MAMSAEERQQMLLTQPVEKIIPKNGASHHLLNADYLHL